MKYLPIIGFTCISCFPTAAMADADFYVGASYLSTEFTDGAFGLSGLFANEEIDDDTSSGFDLFVGAEWHPLLNFRLGYTDHGEFSYVGSTKFDGETDLKGTVEVQYLYLTWSPKWRISDSFAMTVNLGGAKQNADVNNELGETSYDDGGAFYFSFDAEYKFTDQIGVRVELGDIII
ncbi:hypothetical protein EZV61_07315 [Corallincola luteus]|uniref:Outer membrane protein beta-barrel domain-containing protein n=1 Tax=Corallincola luteus TaxID=1775177 RepID=A0ABY2AMY5_9GAMM|nr:outer membrane beta-barrel protein [Corallincola luteus]TCI03995.1 hypothetical protein EZV61_07315 [Corallincola luteus]